MSILGAMFDEVVGSDAQNRRIAGLPLRMVSTQFNIAAGTAAVGIVGAGLSFDFI